MPDIFKKRSTAIIICALVIILSTMFSAHRSLSGLRNEVETLLITGVDGNDIGVEKDLSYRVDYAGNLIAIAQKYDGLDSEIDALAKARADLTNSKGGADEKYALNNIMTDAFDSLNSRMVGLLSDKDEESRVKAASNFNSRQDTLTREAARYNAKAREFNNNVLGAFPANFLKAPAFVSELPYFG